ncbi:uncharacterized protein LOC135336390 isoform X2 [Halichondria panicea]|uniref:uncharacterized protein LOC135336390 isoform X2 n=1 Tax=Halichondria panicea TaxID=6063 RepID=UPI00312BADB1
MEEWKVHVLKGQVNDQDILDEMSQNELVQQVKSLEFLLRESEENTQKLEAKLKGLVDDKKVLEQGLSDTKNRLEGELNVLSSEKQHFNDRLRDKDTAMEDLSNKFTELAKERDAMICKCDWYQTQLKESTPEHQQSLKRLLNKKFKEVEDLHEELHKIKIQLNGLTLQYKEAELVLVNQSKIIETQFNDLEKKMAEIKALKAATFKQTSRDGRQHRSTSPRQVTNRRRQSESNAVLNTSTEEAAKFGIPVHNVQASTPTNFQTSRSPIPLSQQIVQFPPSGIVTAVEAGIPQSSNQLSDIPQNDTKKVYVNQPPSNSVPQNHLYHNIDGILIPPDSPPDISSGVLSSFLYLD